MSISVYKIPKIEIKNSEHIGKFKIRTLFDTLAICFSTYIILAIAFLMCYKKDNVNTKKTDTQSPFDWSEPNNTVLWYFTNTNKRRWKWKKLLVFMDLWTLSLRMFFHLILFIAYIRSDGNHSHFDFDKCQMTAVISWFI